jgi:hypothetical protein
MDIQQLLQQKIREHRCERYYDCHRQATFQASDGRYWCCMLCRNQIGIHADSCVPPVEDDTQVSQR